MFRNVLDFAHKDGAHILEPRQDRMIMNDGAAHVNGPTKDGERLLHTVDRASHAGAKTPWIGEQNSAGGITAAGQWRIRIAHDGQWGKARVYSH